MSIADSASDGHFCNGITAVVDSIVRNAAHGGESSQAITGLGRTESGATESRKGLQYRKRRSRFLDDQLACVPEPYCQN